MSDVIIGTPIPGDLVAPWALRHNPSGVVTLSISSDLRGGDNTIEIDAVHLPLDSFYELREAVNDLYDHIREEQSTD